MPVTEGWGKRKVIPEAEGEELGVWLCLEMSPRSDMGTTEDSSPWLFIAAHSSPGSQPKLEAQQKPSLSEVESGVLPILPPEKERENEHLLRMGSGALPNFPPPLPIACCDLGYLGTGEGMVWKEAWCEESGRYEAALGQDGGGESGSEILHWKGGKAVTNNFDCW